MKIQIQDSREEPHPGSVGNQVPGIPAVEEEAFSPVAHCSMATWYSGARQTTIVLTTLQKDVWCILFISKKTGINLHLSNSLNYICLIENYRATKTIFYRKSKFKKKLKNSEYYLHK